jgi:hypothetical protein
MRSIRRLLSAAGLSFTVAKQPTTIWESHMPPKALFYYYAVAYVFVFTAYYFVSNA